MDIDKYISYGVIVIIGYVLNGIRNKMKDIPSAKEMEDIEDDIKDLNRKTEDQWSVIEKTKERVSSIEGIQSILSKK